MNNPGYCTQRFFRGGRGLGEHRSDDGVVFGVAQRKAPATPRSELRGYRWWRMQRLHGLCEAFQQPIERNEPKYISDCPKTRGGIARMKRLLMNASPSEYDSAG